MDSDPGAFLSNLNALNSTSVDGRVVAGGLDGGGGSRGGCTTAFGARTGSRGCPTPTQFTSSFFDFTSNHNLPLHRQVLHQSHQHPAVEGVDSSNGEMDLVSFNMFASAAAAADKHNDAHGGRRDDNMSMNMSPSTPTGQSQSQIHHQNQNNNIVSFDALQQLIQMQMQFPSLSMPASTDNNNNGSNNANHAAGSSGNPNTAMLLEQQLRLQQLQQLQQLQNQIFQQQIELISGQTSLSGNPETTPLSTNQFQGLPTPVNSTELRPQPPPNIVPPMMISNYLAQPGHQPAATSNMFNTAHQLPQGPNSAPAHLAFSTQAPLLSPGDIDFDLSPLTSPWLGAAPYQQAQQQLQQHTHARTQSQAQIQRERKKRGASSSGDDADGRAQVQTRKRQSPGVRASIGGGGGRARRATNSRGSVSVSSTPAIRAQQPRRESFLDEIVGDTPSPVDLSMPPPAPPLQTDNLGSSVNSQQQSSASESVSASTSCSTQESALSPVTPASIMNLGRLGLGSGLSSPRTATEDQQVLENSSKGKGKSKSPPKLLTASTSASASTSTASTGKPISKRASSTSLVSPSLKPLLPGGLSTSSAVQLGSASNYTHHVSGSATALHIVPSTPLPPPAPAIRKTSHKAAEQKRRDSLKTTFDQLRLLLPPLPLPNEEGYLANGEERLPPGAMPPRGPPRGDVTGPNRSVSKLMLLRCGNEYIKRLKGRVDRRDEYISELKREVRALRAKMESIQIQTQTQTTRSRQQQQRSENERILQGDAGAEGGEDGGGGDPMTRKEANELVDADANADADPDSDVDVDIDMVAEDIEKVDLEKDLDAEEQNAPRLGLGATTIETGEDADEEFE